MQLVDDRERRLRTALATIESEDRKIRRNHLIRILMVIITLCHYVNVKSFFSLNHQCGFDCPEKDKC